MYLKSYGAGRKAVKRNLGCRRIQPRVFGIIVLTFCLQKRARGDAPFHEKEVKIWPVCQKINTMLAI